MANDLDYVREYIRQSGLTQEDWARLAGLKYWTVQKFMSQTDTDPRASTYIALQQAIEAHRAKPKGRAEHRAAS